MLSDQDLYASMPGSDYAPNLTPERLSSYVARSSEDVRAREESQTVHHLNPAWIEWVRAREGVK